MAVQAAPIHAIHLRALALVAAVLVVTTLPACNAISPTTAPQAQDCLQDIPVRYAGAEHCLKPGDTFRDGDAGPQMVVIAPGSFAMASPDGASGGIEGEGSRLEVTIAQPFAAGRTEITFENWDACAAAQACSGDKPSDHGWLRAERTIIDVSWPEVQGYLAWLSEKTGAQYRLLTEIEWEYAARVGLARDFGLDHLRGTNWEWVADCREIGPDGRDADGARFNDGDCLRRVRPGGPLGEAYRYDTSAPITYAFAGFRVARTLAP
ncbi:MAG: SUMF1/EgtB/PvdO family nonheme iron enzyme [Rhizobiales bacterium]|nr:SUMF1/EgtB/PvdO family nonheme iron enzyme [Hyphomicrobiales bacterium]